ncbi:hypothetical protein BV20DRAFT_1052036 [Pilatotrama ljubarskyi]|nr:hypothetical protein BV20DRAFT_1052036 [Pilatotrama ljubarskyi]
MDDFFVIADPVCDPDADPQMPTPDSIHSRSLDIPTRPHSVYVPGPQDLANNSFDRLRLIDKLVFLSGKSYLHILTAHTPRTTALPLPSTPPHSASAAMDEFSTVIITLGSVGVLDPLSPMGALSHTSPSFADLSAQDRAAVLAHLTSSAPVNEDRIEGYNGYCVIA